MPDALNLRTQIVLLMDKNSSAKADDSLTGPFVTTMCDTVLGNSEYIMSVLGEHKPELVGNMSDHLNKTFSNAPGKRVGKLHRVEKLVDIWMVFRQVPELLESRSTRSNAPLRTYIDTMTRFYDLGQEAVGASVDKYRTFKPDPMPPGEKERQWMSPGVALDPVQFPTCPDPRCNHGCSLDQPPSNATADADNKAAVAEWVRVCQAFDNWKKGKGGPRPRDIDGTFLEKRPPKPEWIKKYIRCHCGQNRADLRTGKKCRFDCKIGGVTYPLGKCPICLCCCSAYCEMEKYVTIRIATSLDGEVSSQKKSSATQTREFIDDALNVNRLQQQASTRHYRGLMKQGKMSADTDVMPHISNEGYTAQAMHIARNAPSQAIKQSLRGMFSRVTDRRGSTFTEVGDMRTYGKRSAADDRMRNNDCISSFNPRGMSDEDCLQQAVAESAAAAPLPAAAPPAAFAPTMAATAVAASATPGTPQYIARTREAVLQMRKTTDKKDKKRKTMTHLAAALSNPKNEAVVNALKLSKDDPTPDRVEDALEFMDDLKGIELA